jgi:hypothetical protein
LGSTRKRLQFCFTQSLPAGKGSGAKIEFAKTAKMGLLNFWNVDLYETLCLGDFVAFGILMKLNR